MAQNLSAAEIVISLEGFLAIFFLLIWISNEVIITLFITIITSYHSVITIRTITNNILQAPIHFNGIIIT